MFSKSICSTKEHWWSLTSSWPDEIQKVFSTTHGFFLKLSIDTTNDFHEMISHVIDITFSLLCFIYYM